jgi:serine-type D-Ala-D-Ala carboxypeptidase (penicillin-binding protein 5/6)
VARNGTASRAPARGSRLAVAAATLALVLPGSALSQGEKPGPDPAAKDKPAKQKAGPAGPPKLDARAWILIDPRDDEVLASSAPNRELPIASATKLMTARLALKELKVNEKLKAPPYQALPAESLLGLRAGEKMAVRDLLYALVLESANDAAATIATGVSGSVPRFVNQMNREAARLGLENTSYSNPIGLDDPANYSSAADLAALAGLLLKNKLFARVADTQATTLRSGDSPRRIDTRNTLLNADPTADGVKTGHTQQAGYVLVGSATREGTRLVSVVLGAGSEAGRDAETEKLLDYGFSLYRAETPVTKGEELADPKLDYRSDRLALVAGRQVEVSARRGQPVDTRIEAPEEVSGTIEKGERLGRVLVTVDGRVAGATPLVASESVEAATLVQKTLSTVQNPVILLPAGLFVIVVGLLLALRARRSEPGDEIPQPPPEPKAEKPEKPKKPKKRRLRRDRGSRERTPEERRQMHEERMRRRRQRSDGEGPG